MHYRALRIIRHTIISGNIRTMRDIKLNKTVG